MLDSLDLSLALPRKSFKNVQKEMLDRLFELSELVYEQKRPVIVVFEGWDAAGKGTTIRRLTERLDARGYKVLSTQAPRTHEMQKPWLWRFWMNIPRYGQIAIFDRSWYGRVLIERVEGLTPIPEWIAAYEEINQFERTLAHDGTVFVKFWLHISKAEQLRRFLELSQQPENAWRVTAEDWEHHRKYEEYLAAVRDMLANTSTPYAPWSPIAATDREYRLYAVLRTLLERLETALDLSVSPWPSPADLAAQHEEVRAEKTAQKLARQEAKQAAKATARDGGDLPADTSVHNGAGHKQKAKKMAAPESGALVPSAESGSDPVAPAGKQKKKKDGGGEESAGKQQ